MQPLKKRSLDLLGQISATYDQLAIDAKQEELMAIEEQLSDANVWANPERAQILARESATLRGQVEPWQVLKSQISDIVELIDLGDATMLPEFEQQINALEDEYRERRKELLFDGEYDGRGAILKLSSGAGGTDAQDWTEMLERMYLRWAEKSGLTIELVERSTGEMAGIKSATYIVRGAYAYGKLRSEHGVHRLVRLSPFNSDNLRQTSFALVEVMPEIDAPDEVSIADKDLKIDVYRSGGHGGQSVNTTDSAVRVTHIPTGTVVAIQNERSQIQNRETALKILRGKLTQMKLEQHAETLADLRAGESASWGAQIRNYILHPYTMVKDTRTKHENRDVQRVLDGSIDEFIDAYLSQGIS
jgi:peptide chain release factor 2